MSTIDVEAYIGWFYKHIDPLKMHTKAKHIETADRGYHLLSVSLHVIISWHGFN